MDHVSLAPSPTRTTEPSLLFVHGFLGGAASWDAIRARLAPTLRTHALTLLGHGADRARDEGAVSSFDDEITRQLTALEGQSFDTLVGYSLGARVALGLAARTRRPFSRLVLVAGREGLGASDEADARRTVDDALADALLSRGLPAFVDQWEALPLFETQRALPDADRAAHRARRLAHDPEGVSRALRVLSLGRMPRYGRDAVSRTGRVELVVGEHDAKFRELAQRFHEEHRRFGDLRVHVIAGAGHDVVLERPDALAALLEERP